MMIYRNKNRIIAKRQFIIIMELNEKEKKIKELQVIVKNQEKEISIINFDLTACFYFLI